MKTIKLIIWLLSITFSTLTYSQDRPTNECLEDNIEFSKEDTAYIDTLTEEAWRLRITDPIKAKNYAFEAFNLSKEIGYCAGEGIASKRLGYLYKKSGQLDTAQIYYQHALDVSIETSQENKIAENYYNLGELYRLKGNNKNAEACFTLGLKYLTSLSYVDSVKTGAKIYNRLGIVFSSTHEFEKAIFNIEKSIELREKFGQKSYIATGYMTLGSLLLTQKNYTSALETYKKSKSIYESLKDTTGLLACLHNITNIYLLTNDASKANETLNQTLKIQRSKKISGYFDTTYELFGSLYFKQENYLKAIEYYEKSLDIRSSTGENLKVANVYTNLGFANLNIGYYRNAESYFIKAKLIYEGQDQKLKLSSVYDGLSKCYNKLGDTKKAFLFPEKQNTLEGELMDAYRSSIDSQFVLAQLREERKQEKLTTEIELKQKEKSLLFNRFLIAVIGLIGFLFFMLWRNRKLQVKKVVAEQREQMALFQIDDLMKQHEIEIANSRADSEEVTRKEIARELHDGVSSLLSTVKMHFKAFANKADQLSDALKEEFGTAFGLLDDASKTIRKVSHKLDEGERSLENGLVFQLERLVSNMNKSGIISAKLFTHGLETNPPREVEFTLHRVIQELFANVLKHAKAKEITLELNRVNGILNCIVADDGIGFTKEVMQNGKKGIGLKSVIDRVQSMNGDINFDTGKGAGTTVSINIPWESKN